MDAEKIGREGLTRRLSFRKSLAEAGLPEEYLEKLEQKRRQLDDSIHKYIASKEREYKQYEKDLRQQRRLSLKEQGSGVADEFGPAPQRRALSDGAPALSESLRDGREGGLVGREMRGSTDSQVLVDEDGAALDEDPGRQHENGKPHTNGNRDSKHHSNRELNGLFTPPFLAALEDDERHRLERTTSAPISYPSSGNSKSSSPDLQRTLSDTYTQARPKRPVHLQLAHRTSSSGSSVDGKLVSAMKSSASSTKNRNRRKRVSLAVGDVIVAPADNVPVPVSNNRRASHSRLRSSPAADRERKSEEASLMEEEPLPSPTTALPNTHRPSQAAIGSSLLSDGLTARTEDLISPGQQESVAQTASPFKGDIGDMWHLEDSDDGQAELVDPESDADAEDVFAGEPDQRAGVDAGTGKGRDDVEEEEEEEEEGEQDETEAGVDVDEHGSAVHLEFRPGSVAASQQPTSPGFRRPSVSADPGFQGSNYSTAAYDAEANGIYGSSYIHPTSKASFRAGSLGESYMARNAEWLSQARQSSSRP
ncbi:hypothetical protein K431DRAFT_303501 [Polychaeton citri CBS 116435]|uniref:Uncharacterized protein n=1 Tax=Polychaeton citri CBS 116435 TaxID=1314669 RepID=A0A9P4QBA6_9PEZI|nr:hypothetical protein K431DRAFT_303501 [Polychaeton citri CBS 116435]